MGKMIFSVLETSRACSIFTSRISFVVHSFIRGGWMRGMSAM